MTPHNHPLPPGFKDAGNGMALGKSMAEKAGDELSADIAAAINKKVDRLKDNTIDLAIRSLEARAFLEAHTDAIQTSWLNWMEETGKVMESIRQTRVAIGLEANKLLSECGDVRKFFLADDHAKEIARLREFVELCERLRALKADGTLDKLADTILKLS